ncbi:TBC1 domain family member 30-like [Tropilaelaps mercedesae]|uniref:TBC1 domain family member 30-like n=1 Tax=Tropilaelaps mercedesae TaxID=418985 RepID=A0A1V9XZQ9_9ACAR|nr:TBC1 domain family member 30-like [Tropilaelaps mercedesae]
MAVKSADEFYSIMGVLAREMLEFGLMDCNELVQTICSMAPFPFPQLQELREKYTFDIRPFAHNTHGGSNVHRKSSIRDFVGLRLFYTDEDDEGELDEDQLALASAAWYLNQRHSKANVTLDIGTLKRQYAKLRDRQRQAHVILTSTLKTAIEQQAHPDGTRPQARPVSSARQPINTLLAGHKPIVRKVRPIPKVQFAMPPEESGREANRPRGPRTMRTKIVLDEPSDVHKQQPLSTYQQTKQTRQGATPAPNRGETLTWEQIERDKRDSGCARTRSWSSSSDSSSTSLCDQGVHDPEGDSSSLCASPILPASPRSPRLTGAAEAAGSVFHMPQNAQPTASPTTSPRTKADKSGGRGDCDPTSAGRDQRQRPTETDDLGGSGDLTTAAAFPPPDGVLCPDSEPIQTPKTSAASFHYDGTASPLEDATVSDTHEGFKDTTQTNAVPSVVAPVNLSELPATADPDVITSSQDGHAAQAAATGTGSSVESCSDEQVDASIRKTTQNDGAKGSLEMAKPRSSNLEPKSRPCRKLIIADTPPGWSSSGGEKESPSSIAAAPQMWHNIPGGPFVEEEETDGVHCAIGQSASGVSSVSIKEHAGTPPSLDELLERYTKVTHLVEDASARLVASTSIDSGDSRTPPSRADSPPAVSFNPFPTQRTSTLDSQVARRLGLYSNH